MIIVVILNENSCHFVNLLEINHSQLKSACKNVDLQRSVKSEVIKDELKQQILKKK